MGVGEELSCAKNCEREVGSVSDIGCKPENS
jgi:hypothetical protein